MKQLFVVIQKEFYHILRDRRTLVILVGLPLIQILLFGFAITNEIRNAKVGILAPAGDEVSREISERLLSSGYFRQTAQLQNQAAIHQAFRENKIQLAIVFPSDLQERFYHQQETQVQLIADAADPNTATTLINYASAIINDYQMEKLGLEKPPLQMRTEVKMLYNPRLKSVFLFVPGVMTIILMLISAMMTSIALTKEKELGTMEILLASPLRPTLIIFGKVIPYLLLAMVDTTLILLLGRFVFGMPVVGSLGLLIAECILFVLTSLALGILISTRTSSQQVAMMMSLMVLMMPTIMLSGFIFPIESMPKPLQIISNILPARWFIVIIKNIMLKGTGLAYVWKETLVLGGMFLFLVALGIRNFKYRLQ